MVLAPGAVLIFGLSRGLFVLMIDYSYVPMQKGVVMKYKVEIGGRFGRLTVVIPRLPATGYIYLVECLCDCGNPVVVERSNLVSGNSNSCGCYKRDRSSESHQKPVPVGSRFGRWTVIQYDYDRQDRKVRALCRCDCGSEAPVSVRNLRAGRSHSCGCLERELTSERARTHEIGRAHV